MSTHPITAVAGSTREQQEGVIHEAWKAASTALRPCVIDWDEMALVFTPDLSAAEVTALGKVVDAIQSPVRMTSAEYEAVRAQMQVLRALRQSGRNAYVALTEAERNRQTYDALMAVTEIFLALLRD